jgi:hypothetical protein
MGVGKIYTSMDDAARNNTLGLKVGTCIQVSGGYVSAHPSERPCGSEAGLWKVVHVYKSALQTGSCEGEVAGTSDFISGKKGDSYCLLPQ